MSLLAVALAVLMCGSGLAHVTVPAHFRGLVPAWVPAPAAVVALTGAANLVAGVLLAVPTTRSWGGWLAAALITAYLPAHLDGLRRMRAATRFFDAPLGVAARVAVNVGYIAAALAVALAA